MAISAPLDNGVFVWVLPIAALLAFDGWIVVKGHRSLSEHAGNHPMVTLSLLSYLGSHLLGKHFIPEPLRRYDPLAAMGRLAKKSPN